MRPRISCIRVRPSLIIRHHSSSSSSSTLETARAHCINLLRTQDYASHLQAPFLPAYARDAHLALRAFNLEIAVIDSSAPTTAVGALRYQWWLDDVLGALYSSPPSPPPRGLVATLLASAIPTGGGLRKRYLDQVVKARQSYAGGRAFEGTQELEDYAERVYGALQYLALQSVGAGESTALDHVGSHVGKAVGIVAILRGVPVLADKGRGGNGCVVLPLDVMAEFGVRQEDVVRRGPEAPGLRDVVFRVATLANDHLITARKMLKDAGEEGKRGAPFATFLSAIPARTYLEGLEKADFDPFNQGLMRQPWSLPWKMYRGNASKKF